MRPRPDRRRVGLFLDCLRETEGFVSRFPLGPGLGHLLNCSSRSGGVEVAMLNRGNGMKVKQASS